MFTEKEKGLLLEILNKHIDLSKSYIGFYSMLGVGYEEKISKLKVYVRRLSLICKKL